jgi:hypothetical protein
MNRSIDNLYYHKLGYHSFTFQSYDKWYEKLTNLQKTLTLDELNEYYRENPYENLLSLGVTTFQTKDNYQYNYCYLSLSNGGGDAPEFSTKYILNLCTFFNYPKENIPQYMLDIDQYNN